MSCKKYQKLISLYLDRELSPSAQEKLKHHLALCSVCRSYWEKVKQIQQEVASWPEIDISLEDLQEARTKIIKTISLAEANPPPIRKRDFWLLKKWLWAMPILLIIVGSFLLFYWGKKPKGLDEIEAISFTENYYFFNDNNENLWIAFNHFLEQEIMEASLGEIDYPSLLDYFYLALEDLEEEEKENLLNLLLTESKEIIR